ncbi:MAG: hypothetical protein WBM66_17690 [Thiothrix litoralis]
MYRVHFVLGLIAVSTTVVAGDTQTLKLTIPKVVIAAIEPITSLTFAEGASTASGSSSLSISSNDPQAKLQITPTGVSLAVTSSSIACPSGSSSTSTIICAIGIKRTKDSLLAFEATRTEGDDFSINYTLTQ